MAEATIPKRHMYSLIETASKLLPEGLRVAFTTSPIPAFSKNAQPSSRAQSMMLELKLNGKMEAHYQYNDRKPEERCSECKSYFKGRSRKAWPRGPNSKRTKYNKPFSKEASKTSCGQCSPKDDGEDDSESETSTSFEENLPDVDKDDKGSFSLRLRIRFKQSYRKVKVDFIGSPFSDSIERNNRDKSSLRLRIRPSRRNQDVASLNVLKDHFEYTEVGGEEKGSGSEVSKGPETRLKLERCEEDSKTEGLDHGNRLRIRFNYRINPSEKHASDKCNTPFLIGRTFDEGDVDRSSGGIGCARTEFVHKRGGLSRLCDDREVMPEQTGGLIITYDSRRRRTDPQPPALFVSKSSIHGHGLFTRNSIKKGVIILEFLGEVIRESVSEVREKKYLESGMRSFYVFSLVGRERQVDRLCLDSTRRGGLGRFINHCCLPNAEAEIWGKGIVIRAITDVDRGEEITLDYKMQEGWEMCWCGAKNCLGVMDGSG